jgi:hypothetical protein
VLANERVQTNADGQVLPEAEDCWRDCPTHLLASPLAFMHRHIDGQLRGIEFCERYVG